MRLQAQIQMTIGDGTCMTRLKALTILATRMQLNICAQKVPRLFLNLSIWDYLFLDLKMGAFINVLSAGNQKILVKGVKQLELVQLLIEQDMRSYTLYIKTILKKALIFLTNGLQWI